MRQEDHRSARLPGPPLCCPVIIKVKQRLYTTSFSQNSPQYCISLSPPSAEDKLGCMAQRGTLYSKAILEKNKFSFQWIYRKTIYLPFFPRLVALSLICREPRRAPHRPSRFYLLSRIHEIKVTIVKL